MSIDHADIARKAEYKMNTNKKQFPLIPVAAAAAVVILLLVILGLTLNRPQTDDATQAGVAYLEALEKKDPDAVIQIRRQIQQAKLDAQREEMIRKVESGEVDPFTLFQDYCIMGDSRAVGYWYFGFLDESRTITGAGHTIRDIQTNMDTLVAMNPRYIYLCYGLNDTSIGYWKSAEEYVAEYMDTIAQIQERLPDATVIVSSILPARDPAFQRSSKWYNIPAWSAAVEAACKENGIIFANNDAISETYASLWDPDGIHVKEAFYPYWAANLILATLQEGGSALEEGN